MGECPVRLGHIDAERDQRPFTTEHILTRARTLVPLSKRELLLPA
ncbi:hypothetical protein [uncultured Lamprocystis sp.]|jgi:hypothetical protein|nr:hypothetical protein [uncultured Lamprocystis sp.]